MGAAIPNNFLFFFVSPIRFLLVFYFFLFFRFSFWNFIFFQNPNFNSLSFARLLICFSLVFSSRFNSHTSYHSTFFICFVLYSSRLDFSISDIKLRLVFTRINFDLFQHCRLYALTLQLFISLTFLLVINKHLCLCKVWFMLILAILRHFDVFLSVLGVVYRLGIK